LCPLDADWTRGGNDAGSWVYLLEGRTLDAKRSLVKDITDAVVKNLGAPPEAVTVSLVETPKTAKGKGGVLFSDMPARS
jgi:4-oxalocrotonate tautomerase